MSVPQIIFTNVSIKENGFSAVMENMFMISFRKNHKSKSIRVFYRILLIAFCLFCPQFILTRKWESIKLSKLIAQLAG